MNILEIEASKGYGGQEKRTIRLAKEIEAKTIFAVEPDSKIYLNRFEFGIEAIPLNMKSIFDVVAIYKVVKIIKEKKIDIIVTHSGKDAYIGGFASKIANIKMVRVRHLQTPFPSSFSYKFLSDLVVCVSSQVEDYVKSRGAKNTTTIYTGIDINFFKKTNSTIREELNIKSDIVLIGIVAILRSAKRHIDLLHSIKNLKSKYNINLLIAGSGPQEENIKKTIYDLGLKDFVHFLGFREDVVNILNGLDIFVLPSNMEALGTALLEAQSCEIPVVASNVGGIPEAIINLQSGLLFESENIIDLTSKLEILITDKEKRLQFGKCGREFIVQNFSNYSMATKTLQEYKKLLNK